MYSIEVHPFKENAKNNKDYDKSNGFTIKYPDITTALAARFTILQLSGRTIRVPIDLEVSAHKKTTPSKTIALPKYWVSRPMEIK